MTTKEAEQRYLAEYQAEHEGHAIAIHNPHGKPVAELPVIYGWNNGGSPGWFSARLMSEDGVILGGHCCSHEGYMRGDLGILEGTRPDRHELFREHYPNGYRMEFVSYAEARTHAGLQAAFARHKQAAADSEAEEGEG